MEITIQVPDVLEQQIRSVQDRLPEVLERGLQDMLHEEETPQPVQDEETILDMLTSQPSPEHVLAIAPSPALQARVNTLLQRSKDERLTRQEERELDRYLYLEHLVRLAKAQAYKHMQDKP